MRPGRQLWVPATRTNAFNIAIKIVIARTTTNIINVTSTSSSIRNLTLTLHAEEATGASGTRCSADDDDNANDDDDAYDDGDEFTGASETCHFVCSATVHDKWLFLAIATGWQARIWRRSPYSL